MKLWLRLTDFVRGLFLWVGLAVVLLLIAKVIEVVVPAKLGALMQTLLDGHGRIGAAYLIVFLVLAAFILEVGVILITNFIGQETIYRLRTTLFNHIQRLHVGFFSRQRTGQLISRTISDVDQIKEGLTSSLISMVGSGLMLIAVLIGMYVVDWRIALILTCTIPFIYLLARNFQVKQHKCFAQTREALGRINTFTQEHLSGAHVIRSFGLAEQERGKFDEANESFRAKNIEAIRNFAFFFSGIEWIHSLLVILVFVGLVEFGFSGEEFRAGVFFTFSLYLMLWYRPVRDLVDRYNTLQDALASGQRVCQLLDTEPQVRSTPKVAPLEQIDSIVFENISFRYEEEWVLRDVSFSMTKNQTVALVGETGAGKTTISRLLTRFYDPQEGRILVNDRDIRDYPIESVRRQFNTVAQDPVIFSGTVAENLALYDETITEADLKQALKYVGAEFSLDEQLGEDGKRLSSGEKQLLSLARGIVHPGCGLLLDEATANVDPMSEHLIQKALDKLLQSRTALVIAHRLSTIHKSDQILLLHAGRLLERGTHASLVAARGLYEKLYRAQYA